MRLGWPPYSYSALIRAESTVEKNVFEFLNALSIFTKKSEESESLSLLGPINSPISKIRGKKRGQLLLLSKNRKNMRIIGERLISFIDKKRLAKKVRWSLDVDPTDYS